MSQAKSDPPSRRLFCFGLGYSARALARRLLAEGWSVAGTARSPERLREIEALGAKALAFDRGIPLENAAEVLAGTTHLLSSVPPDDSGDPVLDHHAEDIAAIGELHWAGYLSTTGVYGDRDGGWVDESADLRPSGLRSRRRVAAERAWMDLLRAHDVPVHIFRLAGIYGPGRSAIEQLRAGTARRIHKPGQVFSRIHVEDIARVLHASMTRPKPGAVYNVCDDEPAPSDEVMAYAAELLGIEPPPSVPFEEADLSPMARGFYADNRRVSNRRIKQELDVELAYPTYREGLRALATTSRA
jgi:nucleoside-diphosphate-sugar epimerase